MATIKPGQEKMRWTGTGEKNGVMARNTVHNRGTMANCAMMVGICRLNQWDAAVKSGAIIAPSLPILCFTIPESASTGPSQMCSVQRGNIPQMCAQWDEVHHAAQQASPAKLNHHKVRVTSRCDLMNDIVVKEGFVACLHLSTVSSEASSGHALPCPMALLKRRMYTSREVLSRREVCS